MPLPKRSIAFLSALMMALTIGANVDVARAAERTHRTEHFALTWTDDESDPDAPALVDRDGDGVPDTVTRMARAFEDARAFLVEDLGYQAPPTRGRYNLYLSSAIDRGQVRPAPGGSGRSKPSFVTIPTYLMRATANVGQVRSFAVHEYFHAIQLGYDATEDDWIKEASSSWVEGLFEPDTHHNEATLYDFVPRLELGLQSEDGVHEYGAFLFLQFLTERFGGPADQRANIVRELWETMAVPEAVEGAPDDGSLEALERVLSAHGVALDDAWGEFTLWVWQLERFENGSFYRRALRDLRWPSAPAIPVEGETCRLVVNEPDGVLPALAGDYSRFVAREPREGSARLTVRGPAGTSAFAIIRPVDEPPQVSPISFADDGVGVLDVPFGRPSAARVVLGLANGSSAEGVLEYSLRIAGANAVEAEAPLAPSSTIFGSGIPVFGRVYCNGAVAPFAHLILTRTEVVSGSSESIELTTDALGQWAVTSFPSATSTFAVRVTDPLLSSASSATTAVGVRVAVNMTLSSDQVAEGEPVTIEGNVAPTHAGTVVLEYRRPNGPFHHGAETAVDGEGRYRFDHVLPGPGVWEVRTTMPETGDDDHLPGDSAPKLVQVGET